ncbi:TetR family transcriptional regulatory protein [Oleiphilus messinensis]|uniref:TetR family transcriptional regulatory protein n=1 Tax=Oleiphilus messinensis TaxID=141451 RepID=A0A1Y0IAA6_9GAMM|nr:TetR/AcrR family transcriptional regulator [Oleiphilus messinensis]ARU57438.1 TetR family transcriptional regulatory protein [Oleiphilus messinensis]
MARPRRSEHTQKALLEEGIKQLSEHGYHGTGIKQVLDAVRVPKGSFYNYFESKEAYVAAIIREYNQQVLGQFDAFVEGTDFPASQKLKLLYAYMLNKHDNSGCQQGCLVGSIAAEIGGSLSLCQQAMIEGVQLWQRRLSALVVQAQVEGDMRKDIPADTIAELIWSLWEGSLLRMKLEGCVDRTRSLVDVTFNTLLVKQ